MLTNGFGNYGDVDTRVSESDYGTAAFTPDGSTVIAYIPTIRTFTIDMARLSGPAKARWFDPVDGSYREIAGGPITNSGSHLFMPPGKNHAGDGDWVLLLQVSSGN